MNYYELLEITEFSTKEEIKKAYHKLCLQFHPDKNHGDDTKFKEIKEAYEELSDTEKRKKYNLKLFFKDIQFTDYEYELLDTYYHKIIHSNEYKLMKLIVNTIPVSVKKQMWEKFKKKNEKKEIIIAPKSIDITNLTNDEIINLIITENDKKNGVLKTIYIFTNNGIYYFFLRNDFPKLIIDNLNCKLFINFYIAGEP
jgi:curved DNA-binding protein CbpA